MRDGDGAAIESAAIGTEPALSPVPFDDGWGWAAARWMRPAEEHAPGSQLVEGLEYARSGQTRQLDHSPGLIAARVQGRLPQAYRVELRLPPFNADQWERVVTALGSGASQAKYTAALLRGELHSNIEDAFAPLGLRLFPSEPSDIATSCTCDVFRGRAAEPDHPGYDRPPDDQSATEPAEVGSPLEESVQTRPQPTPWCKHVCCVMYLMADRLSRRPLLAFELRGMPESDLLERLRQQRALSGLAKSGASGVPVYAQHLTPAPAPTLDLAAATGAFWDAPLDPLLQTDGSLDLAIEPPTVNHPLLRRLGPSPFSTAKFPLVGLLATVYDMVSRAAIDGSAFEPAPAQATGADADS